MNKNTVRLAVRLGEMGFSANEAIQLIRIERTLQRWGEAECGDSNNYCSTSIERDEETGIPYKVVMPHDRKPSEAIRTRIPDREKAVLKCLEKIMADHPDYLAYHQGDPRGCCLYIVARADLNGCDINSCYTRGIAVCD